MCSLNLKLWIIFDVYSAVRFSQKSSLKSRQNFMKSYIFIPTNTKFGHNNNTIQNAGSYLSVNFVQLYIDEATDYSELLSMASNSPFILPDATQLVSGGVNWLQRRLADSRHVRLLGHASKSLTTHLFSSRTAIANRRASISTWQSSVSWIAACWIALYSQSVSRHTAAVCLRQRYNAPLHARDGQSLGPFHGAIAVPSVTRCRCCRRGHPCAGDTWWMAM